MHRPLRSSASEPHQYSDSRTARSKLRRPQRHRSTQLLRGRRPRAVPVGAVGNVGRARPELGAPPLIIIIIIIIIIISSMAAAADSTAVVQDCRQQASRCSDRVDRVSVCASVRACR